MAAIRQVSESQLCSNHLAAGDVHRWLGCFAALRFYKRKPNVCTGVRLQWPSHKQRMQKAPDARAPFPRQVAIPV